MVNQYLSKSDLSAIWQLKPFIISEVQNYTKQKLRSAGIQESAIEARVMMVSLTSKTREQLSLDRTSTISPKQMAKLQNWITRRITREPLQYITGISEFYGRKFLINKNVLIPRQETETIVEQAILFGHRIAKKKLLIADIGCGSGVISVTLGCELPISTIIAVDISEKALKVTQDNADIHNVSDKIIMRHGNLTEPVNEQCDIVVSNPPYVVSNYLDGNVVQPELLFEPRQALDGGRDGLKFIRPIIAQLPYIMKKRNSLAIIEIDPPIASSCISIAKQAFEPDTDISIIKDLSGLERCLYIERP